MNAQSERGERDFGNGAVNQSPLESFPARRDLCCRCVVPMALSARRRAPSRYAFLIWLIIIGVGVVLLWLRSKKRPTPTYQRSTDLHRVLICTDAARAEARHRVFCVLMYAVCFLHASCFCAGAQASPPPTYRAMPVLLWVTRPVNSCFFESKRSTLVINRG